MKFVEVERLPEKRRPKKSLRNLFDEFISMNVKLARVDITERDYKNTMVGYGVMRTAAKRYGAPIKVYIRNDEIYFERRDI